MSHVTTARDRSLGGCGTCRARHFKCDESRPSCQICQRAGILCAGYDIRLIFIRDGRQQPLDHNERAKFRRPLYTEDERRSMSRGMTVAVGRKDPSFLINSLDEEGPLLELSTEGTITKGPFGVFKTIDMPVQEPSATTLTPSSTSTLQDSASVRDYTRITNHPNLENSDPIEELSINGVGLEDLALPSDIDVDLERFLSSFSPQNSPSLPSLLLQSNIEGSPPLSIPSMPSLGDLRSCYSTSIPSSPILGPQPAQQHWFLLSNYRDSVIRILTPLKYNRKSPWNTLYLPAAMNTLADLSMGSSVNHARSAILCATLALSAWNLSGSPSGRSSTYWSSIAKIYQQQAQQSMKLCLIEEVSDTLPKRAKYKEALMAILSMATLSVFIGSDTVLPYLLDAERLIRWRGLTKPILSRKVRQLHHCYAYLRIMHESTLLPDTTASSSTITGAFSLTRAMNSGSRFRITSWNIMPDYALEKDRRMGEQDLHLEIPGRFQLTMYPEIFGIPESLLALLSQVTRMGNEKDMLDDAGTTYRPSFRDFSIRAKSLEQHIHQWTPSTDSFIETPSDPTVDPQALASHRRVIHLMLLAMHRALLIYFYRRVRDIDSMGLQHEVRQVKDYLQQWQEEDEKHHDYTISSVWPVFIAACEAVNPELQEFFSLWCTSSYEKTGSASFETARKVAENVWAKRLESGNESLSWPEILRSGQFTVICT